MHILKKGFCTLLAAAFLLACAGCGGSSEKEPITLSLWHVYGAQTDSPLNDLVDEFNETVGSEEGIQVEVTMVSNNKNIHNHILAAANEDPGAAELPDLFVAYPKTVLALPDDEILVDYRDYFSEKELSAFVPAFLEDGMVNDRLTILPVAKSTELLFVNKTAFDRFAAATGASLEDLKTWEGLYETAVTYAQWTDEQTPNVAGDAKAMFVHDFHFNYFQVGVESLGEDFFYGDQLAFGPMFRQVWEPYAKAALTGGLWLQGGYATEPLRTGETIVSVASSASVLYFSDEVTYADNTTEKIEMITMPCPVFAEGEKLVMQRGAGVCTVKSTPEREKAAMTFLKWLTEAQCNTDFAVSTGYMPVTEEAFSDCMPQEIEKLTNPMYVALYKGYTQTQTEYSFFTAPQFEAYLGLEESFEENVRLQLLSGRENYLSGGNLNDLVEETYLSFQAVMK